MTGADASVQPWQAQPSCSQPAWWTWPAAHSSQQKATPSFITAFSVETLHTQSAQAQVVSFAMVFILPRG